MDGSALWRHVQWLAMFVVLAMAHGVGAAGAPIKILTLDWTSQIVVSHIVGNLLKMQHYDVTYISEAADGQWFLLSSGQADLQVEVWEGSMANEMVEFTRRGLIFDAGSHAAMTREEWWYPSYVKQRCPSLPDWRALKNCAELFAIDGGSRGVYYTGPWEKRDRARIRALGLPFDVVTLKDGGRCARPLSLPLHSVNRCCCSTGRRIGWSRSIPASLSSFRNMPKPVKPIPRGASTRR